MVEWWVNWCSENTSLSGNWMMLLKIVVYIPFNHLMLLLAQENSIEIVSTVTMKSLDLSLSLIVLLIYVYILSFMTGPKPPPKWALHIVQSRASSFKWEYPLLSLRSSNSFLRLLPHLPVTSIPTFVFPSITRCRRQSTQDVTNPVSLLFTYFM